ncbi:MAG: ABC transporter ATP-binding protein [Caldibacillus sp.]
MKIELKNITKSFDKKTNTIDNLNLSIEDGEFIALLGPSGCGKTTTMLMIAGIYKPDSGDILFDGQRVNEVEPKDRNVGMVFQSYALYPHMSVLDNIAFPLKQQKVKKEERIQRAKEAAATVHLEQYLHRKPGELSGGQQQRVALARAIVKNPRLLLLDEPMSNLDERLRIEMRSEISRLQKKLGITTILVTHDQQEAMTLADRIAVMKDGQIIQYDTPMALYYQPENLYVARFIGTPPMNFLHGSVNNGILHLHNRKLPIETRLLTKSYNGDVIVGIRPHDIQLGSHGDLQLEGTIQFVETIGHAKLINVLVGDTMIRFFTNPFLDLVPGMNIQFSANSSDLHIFDGKTEKRILKKKDLKAIRKSNAVNQILPHAADSKKSG